MKSTIIHLFLFFIFGSLNGITNAQSSRWASSDCKPHTDNCDNYCDGIKGGNYENCYALDNSHCWIWGFITGKICNCRCDTPDCNLCGNPCHVKYCRPSKLIGACSFDDISKGAVKSKCDISKLDKVDQDIVKKIAFNVGGSILGKHPLIGFASNIVWSVWNSVIADNNVSLSNGLRTEIDNKISDLKDCMDSKISDLKFSVYDGKRRDIATRYEQIIGASGSDKISRISILFDIFSGYIADIFKDDMSNTYSYTDYESMLPIYTALVPLWASLTSDQLFIQQNQSDWSNYKNDAKTAMNGLETFKTWINRAKQSIKNSLIPPNIQPSCNDPQYTTFTNHESTYYDAKYRMDTSKKGTQCGYDIVFHSSDWWSKQNWCGAFNQFVQQKKNEINSHIPSWERNFDERYIENINLYIDSLISPVLEIKNNNKCLDVINDNVVVADCNNNDKQMDQQKWYYVFSTNEIKNRDGKCLDVVNWVGPNVAVWHCNGATAQKWYFSKTTKEIKNDNGKCLDIDGSNVQIYDCNGLSDQQWDESIVYMNPEIKNNGKCLDGWYGNLYVKIADCNNNDRQKWYYVQQTYEIRNVNGKCLDASSYIGIVQVLDCNGYTAQKWYYSISTKEIRNANGKCLDVVNWDGPNVAVWDCNGSPAQIWDSSIPPIKPEIKNGGKCLSVENGNVIIENCADNNNDQKWYYIQPNKWIQNTNGQCLDVANSVGPNVQLWNCNGAHTAQKWYLNQKTKAIENYNGKCLHIANGIGPNVQIHDCSGQGAQIWSASIMPPNTDTNINTMGDGHNIHNNIYLIFMVLLLFISLLLVSLINIYYCVKNKNKMKYGVVKAVDSEFYETE